MKPGSLPGSTAFSSGGAPLKKATLGRAILLLSVLGSASAYAAASSCVGCHTDVSTMKALVPPPVISNAESGEG